MGEPLDLYRAADRRRGHVFGFVISAYRHAGAQARGVVAAIRRSSEHSSSEPYDVAAMMLIFTVFIVGVFYCLDALYGERRDRSILFWKSLPVSDLTTVLSKVIIPLAILPLITFVIIVCTQLIMLLMSSVVLLTSGLAGDDLGTLQLASASLISALRLGRARALARADLRLAAAGFRLGAARDISLGGVAVARDQHFREDHVQHLAFYQNAGKPPDRIRGRGFRFPGPTITRIFIHCHNSRREDI